LGFVCGIFQTPELALLPTVIILAVYGSRYDCLFRMPGGLLCILAGVILVALLRALHVYHFAGASPLVALGITLAATCQSFRFLRQGEGWEYLSVLLPMSALDTIVSLRSGERESGWR